MFKKCQMVTMLVLTAHSVAEVVSWQYSWAGAAPSLTRHYKGVFWGENYSWPKPRCFLTVGGGNVWGVQGFWTHISRGGWMTGSQRQTHTQETALIFLIVARWHAISIEGVTPSCFAGSWFCRLFSSKFPFQSKYQMSGMVCLLVWFDRGLYNTGLCYKISNCYVCHSCLVFLNSLILSRNIIFVFLDLFITLDMTLCMTWDKFLYSFLPQFSSL